MRLKILGPWLITIIITVLLAELVLRVSGLPFLILRTTPDMFWVENPELGWSRLPNMHDVYTNSYYEGHITTDRYGNRLNSSSGTYIDGFKNILFIGDSTTASLEVDDDETIPALLEKALRKRGLKYNVINLGVRGYGTDQSVMKAIRFSKIYKPADIIYLYFDNDIYNNNTVRKPGRLYGKGVYIRRDGEDEFTTYNYPVPQYERQYGGIVVFDHECRPSIYEVMLTPKVSPAVEKLKKWLRKVSYLYRAVGFVRRQGLTRNDAADSLRFDPYVTLVEGGVQWHPHIQLSFEDNGLVRNRCRGYLDDQMRFLLGKLRSEVEEIERLHLIQFPDVSTIGLLSRGDKSPNFSLFTGMLEDNLIDTYLNIPQKVVTEGINIESFRCKGDMHFCEEGNVWMSNTILDHLQFD